MKIAILGDTHWGSRNNNQTIQNFQIKFYRKFFFPMIERLGIKTIIQTGDYFDSRKWLNVRMLSTQQREFVEPTQELGCDVHVIIGNHDTPLRHSLEDNSVKKVLGGEENFIIHETPIKWEFEDRSITFMPWICKENYDHCLKVIKGGGDILVGHFDIIGFEMHAGHLSDEGFKASDFKGWKQVISGHYHSQSQNENITYVGTPYEMQWSDEKSKHGFWIFDTFDGSMEFFENPYNYFHRIIWEDGTDYDIADIEDCYVKLVVRKKTDFEQFESFIDKINFGNPHELKIIESFEEYNSENVEDIITITSTESLIDEYIDDVSTHTSKEKIKEMMKSIYQEAMEEKYDNL